jgi:hypothetical protein
VRLLNVPRDVRAGRPTLVERERAGRLLGGVDRVLLVALLGVTVGMMARIASSSARSAPAFARAKP